MQRPRAPSAVTGPPTQSANKVVYRPTTDGGHSSFVAAPVVLGFDVGARRIGKMTVSLWRHSVSLVDAMAGVRLELPPLPDGLQGYKLRAVPEAEASVLLADSRFVPWVRQSYARCYTDLTLGFDVWFETLSSSTRQGLRRKSRKLTELGGGSLDVRCYRTPDEMDTFFANARQISAISYQEKLLSAGLPADAQPAMRALAAQDKARGFIMFLHDQPVAYLYTPAQGDVLLYAYLGYDPEYAHISPGSILQMEAFRLLMIERRFRFFDFTEGGGRHKLGFASGSIPSLDILLLLPTLPNRMRLGTLAAFDGMVSAAKQTVDHLGFRGVRKLLRG